MKLFRKFNEQKFTNIQQLIVKFPLATLTIANNDKIKNCHIPLVWQDNSSNTAVSILTNKFEQIEKNPWSSSDNQQDFFDKLCKAVVGFKLQIIDIQAQFKLSQNKSSDTINSIINDLQKINTAKTNEMANNVQQANR
ncbi:FMN-binding negative transcriptional regulator [Faucicola boevrei]|uniref:FMN-binding negative transcriptional regulator n=1 Tax=Faucicola boevrei TaxID=346665 RepID=UPI0003770C3D|nr:FMN-binding negative transcriptional regulator [Moraxella boevrei]